MINQKRGRFERYKVMSDLISSLQKEQAKNNESDEEEEEFEDEETTAPEEIKEFNSWAKNQARILLISVT